MLTAGQAADSPQFIPVLGKLRVRGPVGRPRTRPDAVAADKAYSSRGNRAHLRRRGITAVIPEKKDQAANRKKEGLQGRPARQPRHRPLQREEHRRASDQQAQGLARHRHPLRQDPRQLPRRPPPARLDDLDQRPHPDP
ncbi:transposase [Streptomyces sp. NBC_00140]|uniref:transposase n=1 Tax=Streptomyces sp. NBC_00140 TaxID=2975664 RepID=UPI00338D4469